MLIASIPTAPALAVLGVTVGTFVFAVLSAWIERR